MTRTATTELPCCAAVAARRDPIALDAHRGLHLLVAARKARR